MQQQSNVLLYGAAVLTSDLPCHQRRLANCDYRCLRPTLVDNVPS